MPASTGTTRAYGETPRKGHFLPDASREEADRLGMTYDARSCHREERSDEAILPPRETALASLARGDLALAKALGGVNRREEWIQA